MKNHERTLDFLRKATLLIQEISTGYTQTILPLNLSAVDKSNRN